MTDDQPVQVVEPPTPQRVADRRPGTPRSGRAARRKPSPGPRPRCESPSAGPIAAVSHVAAAAVADRARAGGRDAPHHLGRLVDGGAVPRRGPAVQGVYGRPALRRWRSRPSSTPTTPFGSASGCRASRCRNCSITGASACKAFRRWSCRPSSRARSTTSRRGRRKPCGCPPRWPSSCTRSDAAKGPRCT